MIIVTGKYPDDLISLTKSENITDNRNTSAAPHPLAQGSKIRQITKWLVQGPVSENKPAVYLKRKRCFFVIEAIVLLPSSAPGHETHPPQNASRSDTYSSLLTGLNFLNPPVIRVTD